MDQLWTSKLKLRLKLCNQYNQPARTPLQRAVKRFDSGDDSMGKRRCNGRFQLNARGNWKWVKGGDYEEGFKVLATEHTGRPNDICRGVGTPEEGEVFVLASVRGRACFACELAR